MAGLPSHLIVRIFPAKNVVLDLGQLARVLKVRLDSVHESVHALHVSERPTEVVVVLMGGECVLGQVLEGRWR